MKKIFPIFILLFFTFLASGQQWRASVKSENPTFFKIQKAFNQYWEPYNVVDGKYIENGIEKKAYGWKQFKRWEWFWQPRINEDGVFPASNINFIAQQEYEDSHIITQKQSKLAINWEFMGSDNSWGGYSGLGRLNCIAFHPSDSQKFWVGSAGGGIWETTNSGVTWTAKNNSLPVISITDIAVNYNNPNIIYIATGDSDGSYGSAGSVPSNGVLKSIDGGNNWSTTGLSLNVTAELYISRLLIDPVDPNILVVAASNGIWRTTDGGITWNHVFTSGSFRDMEFKPTNSNYLYAATFSYAGNSKIYRSTDNGINWSVVHSFSGVTRAAIAVSNANIDLVDVIAINSDWGLEGLYSSSNSGSSFSNYLVGSCTNNYLGYEEDGSSCGGQGFYDIAFEINPNNANEKWIGGINTWKTTDGGLNWNLNNFWTSNSVSVPVVHADKHFFAFNPVNPTDFYECNDGGVYTTQNGGANWNDITNGLGIGQIYRISTSKTQINNVMCGLQDNGSKEISNLVWDDVTSGDGMECIIDYTDENIEYGTYINGRISKTIDNWNSSSVIVENNGSGVNEEGAWVTSYLMHPTDNNTLIVGKSQVYETTNGGSTWAQLGTINGISENIKSMAYAPSNPQYIYVATNNTIYKTINGGVNWTTFTTSSKDITYIAVDPLIPERLWYTQSGYSAINKVKYYDGSVWSDFSGSLPNVPVNCIVYENGSNDALYIGTDLGVFYRNASMIDWVTFNTDFPSVVVNELEIAYVNKKIWAGTYGRGLWSSSLFNNTPSWDCFTTACVDPGTGNGFYSTLSDCNLLCLGTKINDLELSNLNIYPNPNNGKFMIDFSAQNASELLLEIYTAYGRKITERSLKSQAGNNSLSIDLSKYNTGIYCMRLVSNDTFLNQKIIIK
jgi:photosystem II stability/assembly factor-like uncharacterized protein